MQYDAAMIVKKELHGTTWKAELRKSFGRRINSQAHELGLSLRQIAEKVEMDPSFLSRIVAGTRNPPSDEKIDRLAHVLEIPSEELLLEAGRLPQLPEGTKKLLPDFFRASKNLSEEEISAVITALEAVARKEKK